MSPIEHIRESPGSAIASLFAGLSGAVARESPLSCGTGYTACRAPGMSTAHMIGATGITVIVAAVNASAKFYRAQGEVESEPGRPSNMPSRRREANGGHDS